MIILHGYHFNNNSYNDNLFIERLWRTVKYEEVYLKAYQDGRGARIGLGNYFRFYNTEGSPPSSGHRTPAEVFTSILVEVTNEDVVESLTPDPLRIAEPNLNLAPYTVLIKGYTLSQAGTSHP